MKQYIDKSAVLQGSRGKIENFGKQPKTTRKKM